MNDKTANISMLELEDQDANFDRQRASQLSLLERNGSQMTFSEARSEEVSAWHSSFVDQFEDTSMVKCITGKLVLTVTDVKTAQPMPLIEIVDEKENTYTL